MSGNESISPEKLDALMEKMEKVEGFFEKSEFLTKDDFEKMVGDMGLKGVADLYTQDGSGNPVAQISELSARIDALEKKLEVSVSKSEEDGELDIQKMVDEAVKPFQEKIAEFEKMPMMKGFSDGNGGKAPEQESEGFNKGMRAVFGIMEE